MQPGRSLLIAALAAATVGALLLRVPAIAEPLGIDQSLWASAVRGMSRGQVLYRDVWEQRPPAIYWVYLAAFQVFGWTAATVAWLDLVASAATALLLFAVTWRLAGRLAAWLSAALYLVLTMPAWLYGHGGFLERSVSETFIAVCVGAMALCAVIARERPGLLPALGLGLCAGAAVSFKPNAALYFPAFLAWIALYRSDGVSRSVLVRQVGAALAGSVVAPAVVLVWLWGQGTLGEAKIAVVDFNRYYVGEGFDLPQYALAFAKAVWLRIKTEPLWLGGSLGAAVAVVRLLRTHTLPPLAGLAMLWGAAAAGVIAVNGARLFNSYFINAFVPLALMATWLFVDAAGPRGRRRLVPAGTAALMLVLMLQRGYGARVVGWAWTDIQALRGHEPAAAYLERFGGYANQRGYSARANAELADYIRARTTPDERVFLFGINGAGVYFAADRLTAHRFLRVNFFVATEFPDPRFRVEQVVADLAAAPPAYLVFERLHTVRDKATQQQADSLPTHPDVQRLLSRYRLETTIEDFSVYRRVDGG